MPDASLTLPGGVPRPTGTQPTRLRTLAERYTVPLHGDEPSALVGNDVEVTGITAASTQARPGDLFAALPGSATHGARFAADAVARGAVAVVTDVAGADRVPAGTPAILVEDVRAVLGELSAAVYGNPSATLPVLGVTGTSGKTTTTFLMRAGLAAAGRVPGLIGTVATLIGEEEVKTGFTTPEAPELQALLAVMRERGVTDVAMEVSSHALTMGRADGIQFQSAGFTNLSEDHLDFHQSMDRYFQAKASLFEEHRSRSSVIVVDDRWGNRLIDRMGGGFLLSTVSTTGYPDAKTSDRAAWYARQVQDHPDGTTSFRVVGPGVDLAAGCAIPGRYNVANVVLALAMLHEDGVHAEVAAPAVSAATVPGRMERIDEGQPFLAVVDYSHKPAAVDGALRALRPLTRGRLIIVLGCGGDRDRGKRPHMGEIAARGAELLVVTDDNPRSEDPAQIRRAMLTGALAVPVSERGEVVEVGDREAAIEYAAAAAQPGDTVLIAGKGHESGQEIGGTVHPFDDRDVLRRALQRQR